MPLFDYEHLLYDTLQQHKHVWVKKATGLGVTEFMLRYMAWLCLSNCGTIIGSSNSVSGIAGHNLPRLIAGNNLSSPIAGSQMCIVTGPRIELAITLIDRMKALFRGINSTTSSLFSKTSFTKPVLFDSKETVIELNGVHIEAYPSHHLDAMRGLKDVSFYLYG